MVLSDEDEDDEVEEEDFVDPLSLSIIISQSSGGLPVFIEIPEREKVSLRIRFA